MILVNFFLFLVDHSQKRKGMVVIKKNFQNNKNKRHKMKTKVKCKNGVGRGKGKK